VKVVLGLLMSCAFVSTAMLTLVAALVIKLLPLLLMAAVVSAIVDVRSPDRRPRPLSSTELGGHIRTTAAGVDQVDVDNALDIERVGDAAAADV
jgi:hypothetical protein